MATQAARAPSRAVIIALTAIAYFMVTLDALVVVTALPSIHRAFGGGISTLQWTVSAYTMTFGALIITGAAIGDRLGRRRTYVAGLALFTLASAACALAPNAGVLIACRAVQGVGASIIMPLGLTLLTGAFPAERRGAVIGIWGGIAGLAVACGPLVGGAITQSLNWHWIFWLNVPIGVAAVIGARLRLPESKGAQTRIDLPGVGLITAALALLIWGLVRGGQNGWATTPTIAALAIGATLLAAFVAWERTTPEPMIPLGLFRVPAFAAATGTQLCMTAAIFSAAFLTSQFFQIGLRLSPLDTGLRFLPWTATPLFIAPLAGALSDRVGARALIVPGLALQGLGFAWIVHLAGTRPVTPPTSPRS
jgi:EmrB/QacA subfamily drug resistance transporter